MYINRLNVIVAAIFTVLLTGIFTHAAEIDVVRHVSGEITWVDFNLGKLQFESDASRNTGEITEYRINENETRVTDPTDKKHLTVEDLKPGQHVIIDVIDGQDEKIIQKITVDPGLASDFLVAYGEVEAIEAIGMLTLAGRPRAGKAEAGNPSYFVFEPKDIVVMRSSSSKPVELRLKPGDVVKVEYVVKDGKQQAKSVTLYSPRRTSTTTTTTTTMTQ